MTPAERAARAALAAFESGEVVDIRDLVADDFVDHGLPPGVVPPGDRVAVRATAHGVHRSGHLGFPATGRPDATPTTHRFRAEGDRLAEHRGVRDEYGVLVQVGAVAPTLVAP